MKVLRTTGTFYPHVTGPAYQAYRISRGLEEHGHSSPLVTTDTTPADEEPGYPPEMEPGDSFPFNITRRKSLFSIHQYRFAPSCAIDYFQKDFDLVHCHGYHNSLKDIFYICDFLKDKPFVVHGHGSFSKSNDPTLERSIHFDLYNLIWKRTVRSAEAVVVSSQQEKEDAINFGVSPEKIHVIPAGKDPSVFESIPRNWPEEKFTVLFVGRLAPRRNVEMLLSAVAELGRSDVELRIVGGEGKLSEASRGSYLDELKDLADQLNIDSQVTFTGAKYGDDLIREFRSASVFANPTHYENFGQATLEAAFAGLPIVATPTGIAPELIQGKETGYLVETASEMASKISYLADNNSLCRTMGTAAQDLALDSFTWESIIDDYMSLYQSVI